MNTAVVLSGGGSLGAVQIGMLLALTERGIPLDLFVGTSVGAVNAAYLAAGPAPGRVRGLAQLWSKVRRADIFPASRAAFAAVTGRADHLADPDRLRKLACAHLPYNRLEDAAWPVTVVATDVLTGEEVALSEGPAVEAVMASAALPGIFPPVTLDGRMLMDGGVVDNSPISIAVALGADRVIVLPTGYACALSAPPPSAMGMALHAVTLAVQRRLIAEVAALQHSIELRVAPPLCPVSVSPLDFSHADELIHRARAATRRWLDAPVARDQTAQLSLHRHTVAKSTDQQRATTTVSTARPDRQPCGVPS